jgi:putative oxidoreductase
MGDRGTGGFAPYARSILRIVAGLLFTCHGLQKLFGFFGGMGPNGGHVPYLSLFGLAGFLETFGGILIFLGLFTSPVAFILCGEMAVAYFRAHFPHGFWPIQNHGELPVLFCFIFLYLSTAGGGPLSLDRAVRKR